jgi:hypothetical protein
MFYILIPSTESLLEFSLMFLDKLNQVKFLHPSFVLFGYNEEKFRSQL